MKAFFCKLIPPRPTFAHDMSAAEAKLMQEHAVYWRGRMEKGQVVTFGLVADPMGPYGIGIVEVETDADVQALTMMTRRSERTSGSRSRCIPCPVARSTGRTL